MDLYPEFIQNSVPSNEVKKNNKVKGLNGYFTKDAQHYQSAGKYLLKLQGDITLHPLEWLTLKG